jgi:hypothetical protein
MGASQEFSVPIHALRKIGKHRIGVSYLDESKVRVLQVDDHASGHREQLRNYIHAIRADA